MCNVISILFSINSINFIYLFTKLPPYKIRKQKLVTERIKMIIIIINYYKMYGEGHTTELQSVGSTINVPRLLLIARF